MKVVYPAALGAILRITFADVITIDEFAYTSSDGNEHNCILVRSLLPQWRRAKTFFVQ